MAMINATPHTLQILLNIWSNLPTKMFSFVPKYLACGESQLLKSRKTNCVNVLISCGGREYGVWCMQWVVAILSLHGVGHCAVFLTNQGQIDASKGTIGSNIFSLIAFCHPAQIKGAIVFPFFELEKVSRRSRSNRVVSGWGIRVDDAGLVCLRYQRGFCEFQQECENWPITAYPFSKVW